jgi:spore maturation protein CgeB
MKALVFGLGSQIDMVNAFSEHADVAYWDVTKANGHFNTIARSLVDEHKPDLLFMQIQTPNIISVDTAKYLQERTKVINWTGDVRYPTPQWFIDIGRHIDLTLFSNMYDVEYCRSHGIKADYLQIGFPTEIFKPDGVIKENVPDIVFMGNNVGGFPLSKYRVDMVRSLQKRYGDKFGVYGINWGGGVQEIWNQPEEASYYRGAKIGINLSHFNYSRYSSDRLFRMMGAGCFCLSHHYKDIEMEFERFKHLDTWQNFSELFALIDFYLENYDKRIQMAKLGSEHVHANHTWKNRINQLMQMI